MLSRKKIYNSIDELFHTFFPFLYIYGSFRNNTFHYDPSSHVSFSDLDIISKFPLPKSQLYVISSEIQQIIKHNTQIDLKVSLRNSRIHNRSLNRKESLIIADFEFLYKYALNATRDNLFYQLTKYILRVSGYPYFFDRPYNYTGYISNGISEKTVVTLINNKTSFKKNQTTGFDFLISLLDNSLTKNGLVRKGFIQGWDGLLDNAYSRLITQLNHRKGLVLDATEKVHRCYGNSYS